MRFHTRFLSSVAIFAITCVVCAAAYYYKSRSSEINEVMVFCKLQFNAHNCFDKLMSYIEAARKNVDVCMPGIHNSAIQGRLVNLIRGRNVKLRIIIDELNFDDSNNFFIKELIEIGAEIKHKNTEFNSMQHKFCLIDSETLMTGTLNWGNDRSSDHWNYVYITNKHQLVDPVKREFEELWNTCSDELNNINDQFIDEESCNTEMYQNAENENKPEEMHRNSLTPEVVHRDPLTPEVVHRDSLTPEVYIV